MKKDCKKEIVYHIVCLNEQEEKDLNDALFKIKNIYIDYSQSKLSWDAEKKRV